MTIGISAQAAFERRRTGVEEYTYQLIKHLAMLPESQEHQFFLYVKARAVPSKVHSRFLQREIAVPISAADQAHNPIGYVLGPCSAASDRPFSGTCPRSERFYQQQSEAELEGLKNLPENFIIKPLFAPFLWTQGRLSLEMLFRKPDVLFLPGHVLPKIHPKNSVVTIHGLEFEYLPEMYPTFHQRYLRRITKYAVSHAKKIIAVSKNTKDDLIELYGINPQKISVIYHGVNVYTNQHKDEHESTRIKFPYILFLGTKEKKKNIEGLIKAFAMLKERYKISHKLVLVGGKPNKRFYKEETVDKIMKGLKCREDIVNLDFVSEEEKWNLLKNAQVFVYPSFYEGFGMPVLEAQAAGVAVVTSNVSALPEVAGKGAILVEPRDIEEICEAIYKIIKDPALRNELIKMGQENVKKFSWEKCAKEILRQLTTNN